MSVYKLNEARTRFQYILYDLNGNANKAIQYFLNQSDLNIEDIKDVIKLYYPKYLNNLNTILLLK